MDSEYFCKGWYKHFIFPFPLHILPKMGNWLTLQLPKSLGKSGNWCCLNIRSARMIINLNVFLSSVKWIQQSFRAKHTDTKTSAPQGNSLNVKLWYRWSPQKLENHVHLRTTCLCYPPTPLNFSLSSWFQFLSLPHTCLLSI